MPAKKKSAPKKATKKKVAKKTVVKKTAAKKTAAKNTAAKKTAAKRAPAKKSVAKKSSAKKKTAVKKSPSRKASAGKVKKPASGSKKQARKSAAPANVKSEQPSDDLKKAAVARSGISSSVSSGKKATPIVFSLDDVAELMAAKKTKPAEKETPQKPVKKSAQAPGKPAKTIVDDKPAEKRSHAAASLADILGFNPAEKKKRTELDDADIPKKFKKYYKLLIELRRHVSDEINLHTADTLKHSARDDAGDSASYGNHQADAGTDSFDRDFALSLVSSEQEALHEVEQAILRIKDGSYGVCAVTGKPIPAARLTAVPFARYSVEGQLEHERNQQRKSNRNIPNGGIFGDVGDAPKLQTDDDDDNE